MHQAGFNELRRYHTRPSPFNWGPKNVHFGKTHFRDQHISARIMTNDKNRDQYQAQPFYVLRFSILYLKNVQKSAEKWPNLNSYKETWSGIKNIYKLTFVDTWGWALLKNWLVFFWFWPTIFYSHNFTFASENGRKRSNK